MKTWWLVVRCERENNTKELCRDCGQIHEKSVYPKEGLGILAYEDEERAKLYAKVSGDNYKTIEVKQV